MKTILFALCLAGASSSFAQSVNVYPTVYNFGNSIQVQINNSTKDNIYCSGTIQAFTTLSRTETFFYNQVIRSGSFDYRTFWPMFNAGRITNTFNYIRCSKAK